MANQYTGTDTSGNVVANPSALRSIYSLDIEHEAMGVMRYEEFAVQKTELGTAPGDSITVTTYNNLARGGELTEGISLETKSMSATEAKILVKEFGNAIGLTERLAQLSWDDMMAEGSVLLGRDYATVRDLMLRDALVAGGNVIFANPSASALVGVTDDDVMDVEVIRLGVENLSTANAPKFRGDFYICFVHPHQAAALKRDPEWISAQRYAGSRRIFNGEIGRWEDVVFIQTTHQGNGVAGSADAGYDATLVGTGAAAADLYRATLFSDQAIGLADALPVELRDDGVKDFGRLHGLAWYGIWGAKVLENDYVHHIITA